MKRHANVNKFFTFHWTGCVCNRQTYSSLCLFARTQFAVDYFTLIDFDWIVFVSVSILKMATNNCISVFKVAKEIKYRYRNQFYHFELVNEWNKEKLAKITFVSLFLHILYSFTGDMPVFCCCLEFILNKLISANLCSLAWRQTIELKPFLLETFFSFWNSFRFWKILPFASENIFLSLLKKRLQNCFIVKINWICRKTHLRSNDCKNVKKFSSNVRRITR